MNLDIPSSFQTIGVSTVTSLDDHSVGPNFSELLNYFLAFAPRLSTALLPKDSRREAIDIP